MTIGPSLVGKRIVGTYARPAIIVEDVDWRVVRIQYDDGSCRLLIRRVAAALPYLYSREELHLTDLHKEAYGR